MVVNEVKERIPDRVKKFSDYRLFLAWVRDADAKTMTQLRKELDDEIAYHQQWLKDNQKTSRLGTKNQLLRTQAKYLDFLKRIQKTYMKYV